VLSSIPFFRPTPESLVRRLEDLPPAPRVLHTLQRLIAAPNTTIEKIAEIVQLEPGLSARVVRMASSVHFGRGAHVDTIMEAIQRRVREVEAQFDAGLRRLEKGSADRRDEFRL